MKYATEILWFIGKQQELLTLQTDYCTAQSFEERNDLVDIQMELIQTIHKRLKGKVTLSMSIKIINKMMIKELQYERF